MTKPEELFYITVTDFVAKASSHWTLLANLIADQFKLPPDTINHWLKGTDFPETEVRMRIINFTINHYCYCYRDCK